jgi:hypothetical protein
MFGLPVALAAMPVASLVPVTAPAEVGALRISNYLFGQAAAIEAFRAEIAAASRAGALAGARIAAETIRFQSSLGRFL